MNHFHHTFVLSLGLVLALSACGQPLESDASLGSTNYEGMQLVTDDLFIAGALEETGFEVYLTEREESAEAHEHFQGGTVSLTPPPGGIDWPPPSWIEDLLDRFRWRLPECDPRFCDPPGFIIGWTFEGVYLTPPFVEWAREVGISREELKYASADAMRNYLAEAGLGAGVAGDYFPGSRLEQLCAGRHAPIYCHYISGGLEWHEIIHVYIDSLLEREHDLGIVFAANDDLQRSSAADDLILALGKGLEPVISPLQATFRENVRYEDAARTLETLYSHEGQLNLAKAGFLAVEEEAFFSNMSEALLSRVEDVLEHGRFISGESVRDGRPLPHPFDLMP